MNRTDQIKGLMLTIRGIAIVVGALVFLAGCLGVAPGESDGSDENEIEQPPPEEGYYDDLLALPTPTGSGSGSTEEVVLDCAKSSEQDGVPSGSTRYECVLTWESLIQFLELGQDYYIDVFEGKFDRGHLRPIGVKQPGRLSRRKDGKFHLTTPTLSPETPYLLKIDETWYGLNQL